MPNIEAMKELRRFLKDIPAAELNVGPWCNCAGGRASRDEYFVKAGMKNIVTEPEFKGAQGQAAFAKLFGVEEHSLKGLMHQYGYLHAGDAVTHEEFFAKLDPVIADAERRQAEIDAAALKAVEAALEDA